MERPTSRANESNAESGNESSNESHSETPSPSTTLMKQTLRRLVRAARRTRSDLADRSGDGAAIAVAVVDTWLSMSSEATVAAPDDVAQADDVAPADSAAKVSPTPARDDGRPPARVAQSAPASGVGVVAIYRSLPTEPPTEQLAAALHDLGVTVIVPELLPDLDLDWRPLHPGGSQGEAMGVGAIAAATLVVVPALGVDPAGVRLGQGGGSYDRALARRAPGAVVLAVLYDREYAEFPLPAEPHDVRVDAVVTPRGGVRWLGPW